MRRVINNESEYLSAKKIILATPSKSEALRQLGISRSYSKIIDWLNESVDYEDFARIRREAAKDMRSSYAERIREQFKQATNNEHIFWLIKKYVSNNRVVSSSVVHLWRPEFSEEDVLLVRYCDDYEDFLERRKSGRAANKKFENQEEKRKIIVEKEETPKPIPVEKELPVVSSKEINNELIALKLKLDLILRIAILIFIGFISPHSRFKLFY